MPQNMAGHVLTKELAVGESSGAEMTQNPGVVEERRQIIRTVMTVCLLWNRLSLGTLSSDPMSAILASGTGKYLLSHLVA